MEIRICTTVDTMLCWVRIHIYSTAIHRDIANERNMNYKHPRNTTLNERHISVVMNTLALV